MKVKVCLHNHTHNSKYAINTRDDFRRAFDKGSIDKVAITDHDYINEAVKLQKYFGKNRIIIGEEITTTQGDLIGLYLKKFVPSGLSVERTIQHIKSQNGVIYVPHPYAKKGVGEGLLNKSRDSIDIVETYNAWLFRSITHPFMNEKINELAKTWAIKNSIPGFSSTDCHYYSNIGRSYTLMGDFSNKEEFLASLHGELKYKKRHNLINLISFRTWLKGKIRKDILRFIK